MTERDTKLIHIQNLKTGMVLANDAFTQNGQLLVASETTITENHLFRMNLYQILSAVVYVNNDPDAENQLINNTESVTDLFMMPTSVSNSDIRLNKTENFLRFKHIFTKVDQIVRDHFAAIIAGEPIDEKKLLSTTDSLLKSVRLKSDIFTYLRYIKSDDQHTYVHSLNVSLLCNIFAQWLKMGPIEIEELTLAALIHDIGKTKVSTDILNKSGRLTADEYEMVRLHAKMSYDIIKDSNVSDRVKQAVLLHHERNDGSGYPFGYTKNQIPDFAKILAIADVYNAMTSNRSYHKKSSPFKVLQLFEKEGVGYLDKKFLFIFLENIAHFYLGEEVRLSDGTIGKIVFIHNESPSRPIIQTAHDMIDLMNTPGLEIEEIL